MMQLRKTIAIIWIVAAASSMMFFACSKRDSGADNNGSVVNGFDKTAMLAYYADSMIMPGYTALQQKIGALSNAAETFLNAPSVATQAALKAAYADAHVQYEKLAPYQFGPAEANLLDIFLNFSGGLDYSFTTAGELTGFSVDTAAIENNIVSGNYNLATMSRSSFYAQGFAAFNYLCFAPGAINGFNINPANRKKYVRDVVIRMKSLVDKTAADWVNYRTEFVANTKTNVGSPIGNLVNQLAYQMDILKGPRIGWPFGKQSNGIVFATKCEAYYAGISVQLATENLKGLKAVYAANNSGKGLSGYLIALKSESLNRDVLAQFDLAISKLQMIPDPLSTSLTTNATTVDAAYKETQKLLTLLKTDVASATAVQISFMDNDGGLNENSA